MRRFAVLLLGIVVGCGGGSGSTSDPTGASTSSVVVSTAATTTTTAVTSTSTTTGATTLTTSLVPSTTAIPVALASGSGCAPSEDPLPDGHWFGFVEAFNLPPSGYVEILFDLACYFEGPEADRAAVEDGRSVPVEQPYVRNRNPRIYIVPADSFTIVDDWALGTLEMHDWIEAVPHDSGCSAFTSYAACPVWIEIAGGEAIQLYGFLPEWSGDGPGA